MNPKYVRIYNAQTDGISNYVLIEEKQKDYILMNPITFFWLKKLNQTNYAKTLATSYDKYMFQATSIGEITESVENKYLNTFGKYFDTITVNDGNINNLHDIALFLEHFHFNSNIKNAYERLKASVQGYKLGEADYIAAVGPILPKLCELDNGEYMKLAFCEKLSAFEKYFK